MIRAEEARNISGRKSLVEQVEEMIMKATELKAYAVEWEGRLPPEARRDIRSYGYTVTYSLSYHITTISWREA